MSSPHAPGTPPLPASLARHMPKVADTRESLRSLQGVWDSLSMLSHLSDTCVALDGVRSAFGDLSERLLTQLFLAALQRCEAELQARAQVAADILVRNLFERTADIGFLATDADLRHFASADPQTPADTRAEARAAIAARLREYQRKYTVYEDIVLLDPRGEVLVRLNEGAGPSRSTDPLVAESLSTSAAYVETWRESDLVPGRRSLIYSCAVQSEHGRGPAGVLALVFRLEDECRRVFEGLAGEDWRVLGLLTEDGCVVASSEAMALPPGASLRTRADGPAALLRFAGRRWLAVTCRPSPYQGYAGPGWVGHAMVPLELAFEEEPSLSAPAKNLSAPARAALLASPRLFSPALLEIPQIAADIESTLSRAVWNGNLSLVGAADDRDAGLSKSLLREIGATGRRTREVFTHAIAELNETVLSASVEALRARSALAIDIMDRNLYERACDCRWWALTTGFRTRLAAADGHAHADEMAGVLRSIHALYTVYANLVLFDREGRVVAASREEGAAARRAPLQAEWVARALALTDSQGYVVSDFEPSALYEGRPTYIFAAAIHGLAAPGRAVGGIAIVFDSEPQFRAMLTDTLPRPAAGSDDSGAFGVFIDQQQRVVASSLPSLLPGQPAPPELVGTSEHGLLSFSGGLCAYGESGSLGYREFKGPQDAYRNRVRALAVQRVADHAGLAGASAPVQAPVALDPPGGRHVGECVSLAMFSVGGEVFALPSTEVAEAVAASGVLPLAGNQQPPLGAVVWGDEAVPVLSLHDALGAKPGPGRGELIVLRANPARRVFALRVDALCGSAAVGVDRVTALGPGIVRAVVRPASAASSGPLVQVLCLERLAELAGACRKG